MGLSRTDGGLFVPEGAHEAAVMRALREHDDDLRLVPQDSDHFGRRVYKVFRYAGSNRPAEFILFWGDPGKGVAYPLSMSLVDEVKRHDRGMHGFSAEDSDTINARLKADLARESREQGAELADEFRDHIAGKGTKSILFRGKHLQAARNRVRARTKSRELRP